MNEVLAFIDGERGKFLRERANFAKGSNEYRTFSAYLRSLNRIKKEIHNLSDADQIPLGL